MILTSTDWLLLASNALIIVAVVYFFLSTRKFTAGHFRQYNTLICLALEAVLLRSLAFILYRVFKYANLHDLAATAEFIGAITGVLIGVLFVMAALRLARIADEIGFAKLEFGPARKAKSWFKDEKKF